MTSTLSPCHILLNGTVASQLAQPSEIQVFATCRDERLRLPAFLEHYRKLGANRFFIVDNDSTDGSVDYLSAQPDVRVFRTADRYGEADMGMDWIRALLAKFGVGSWCVIADIDELLVFAGSEHTSLRTLTRFLDDSGFDAFACMLLDLYPHGSLKECSYTEGDNLLAVSPFFDAGPYSRTYVDRCPDVLIQGGMRERIFFPEFRARGVPARTYDAILHKIVFRIPFVGTIPSLHALGRATPPCLTKVPLIRWNAGDQYLHYAHFVSKKTLATDTGVLLHFKFLQDFHVRAVEEVARNEHWNNASDYRRYAALLSQNPNMTLMYDGSTRLEGTAQLVQLGLVHETPEWIAYRTTGTT